MNPYSILPLITSFLVFFLGCFVFLKNRQAKANILFLLLTVATSLWLYADYKIYSSHSAAEASIVAKLGYVPVIFIPSFFLHLSLSILRTDKHKKILFVSYFFGLVFAASLWTDHLISGATEHFWGYYYKAGWLHYFLLLYYGLVLGAAFTILYGHLKREAFPSQERNKIKFLLAAFAVGFLAIFDFLPKFGVEFYPIGFIFASIWMFSLAYAIVRYRLFDINLVISRGVTLVLTVVLGILPLAVIVFFLQQEFLRITSFALIVILAVSIGFLLSKLHPLSERIVQTSLLKTQLKYYQVLRRFSNDMVKATDLIDLLQRFDTILQENLQVSTVTIYLTGPRNGRYPLSHPLKDNYDVFAILRNELPAVQGADMPHHSAVASVYHSGIVPLWRSGDALVSMAYKAKDVLVLGEMEMMARERKNEELEQAISQMKEAKAEVCVPFKRDGKMVGMALLGPRVGDRYYSSTDLDLLHSIGQNACIAVQNALMVEEIKRTYRLFQRIQRLSAMATLAAGVAHEIRNPLMPIGFLMDSVADPTVDRELLMRLCENSKESLRRITNVLDELNELGRPASPTYEEYDVNRVLDGALDLLETQVKLTKQEIVREYESLPKAMVDPSLLKHAVIDIVLNAIEANPPGGKIFMRTRRIVTRKTDTRPPGPGIQIEVTDTGCGIPPENIERVFDPFFTTKHKSLLREGTGLGLAIAHRIIDEHHGSIEIHSEVGKGTSVFINLPVNL